MAVDRSARCPTRVSGHPVVLAIPIMSQAQPAQTDTCTHCGESFDWGCKPGYCSEHCYYAEKGENALKNIRQDHRYCSTCYRWLKDVYRPDFDELALTRGVPDPIAQDAFIGFQEYTEYSVSTREGRECVCGNVDHYHSERLLRDAERADWFLYLVFETYRSEGQIEQEFDRVVFLEEYYWSEDLRYSVGKALHA